MEKPTLKDVANKAGVSTATVSYVLNDSKKYISDDTKKRVMSAVGELGYFTNMSAKSLAGKSSKLIGAVIPQTENKSNALFGNNFYSEILGSIEYAARQKGYQILISGVDLDADYLRVAKERDLDGIIAIGIYADDFFEQFNKTDIPVVLIDSYCSSGRFSNIRIDDVKGEYLATKFVIDHGHENIGFMTGMLKENGVLQKRLQGYCNALEEAGIPFKEENIFEGNVSYKDGMTLARRLIDENRGITAVVATADILAMGAIKEFMKNGIKVPNDISVIGFDDLEFCKYMTPGLTTVKQPIYEKGERAMELLFDVINGQNDSNDVILPLEIMDRESVINI